MVLPGGKIPDEAGTTSTTTSPSSSQTRTTTSPTSSQTAAPAEAHTQIKLSSGAIVGITVGGVIIAILVGALLFLYGRQTTMLQFMRREQQQQQHLPPPMAYPVGGSPIPYHEPNTPMTQNSYVVGSYAYPNYSSRENVVELGSDSSTLQHGIHNGSQKHGMYSDQFDEYRRQNVTGSPLPSPPLPLHPPPPRSATHLEFPE